MCEEFHHFPFFETFEDYAAVYRETATWLPAMRTICQAHGLDPDSLRLAPPGSNIVFWVEDNLVIKLFAPFWRQDHLLETRVLNTLANNAALQVPRIHAHGEVDGWPYLVLSRLPGRSLDEVWPLLDPTGREHIAAGLGEMMAALHRVPTGQLAGLQPEWRTFLADRLARLLENQSRAGVSPEWLDDITRYYAALPSLVPPDFSPVLIHADLNPEHIFCQASPRGWEVSGMIDFADAMLGDPAYEFVAPAFLLAGPDGVHLRRAMLQAYGYAPSDLTPALSRRLTAFILLHRFIDAGQFPALFPHQPPGSMRQLEQIAWQFYPPS